MAMDLLRQLAGMPLPATFRTTAEIDQVRILRAAGLVIALTPAVDGSERTGALAQVLAITGRGREELACFHLPEGSLKGAAIAPPRWKSRLRGWSASGRNK